MLLWAGWSLVFLSSPDAVLEAQTRVPADAWSRVYYAGFTFFTLGVGDYIPGGPVWQIASVVAVANGLFLVTLSITYIVPVLSAVVERRQQAGTLSAMGEDVEELLERVWDGRSFAYLTSQLPLVAQGVALTAQRHLAYPVLHYFHADERELAFAPSVAVLDEAVTVLMHGVAPDVRPHGASLRTARQAVAHLLTILDEEFVEVGGDPPPARARDRLAEVRGAGAVALAGVTRAAPSDQSAGR